MPRLSRPRLSRAVVLTVLIGLLSPVPGALAQEPTPPGPGVEEQARSVPDRAAEVARLTAELAELDGRTDDLQAELAVRRESAEAAMVGLQEAQATAAAAATAAKDAGSQTRAATAAIDQARVRLDAFVAAAYGQGGDLGTFGMLAEAAGPEDLIARAQYRDTIAQEQLRVQDGLERARVEKANADAGARAALARARAAEGAAAAAKTAADTAFAEVRESARVQEGRLAEVTARRDAVQRSLEAVHAADAGLREQRQRFADWQRRMAGQDAQRERAERAAASLRLAQGGDRVPVRGSAAAQRVIDRAMSQLGVQYVWGGGNPGGPSTGLPDAFGSPLDRVGFDCSGLMQYAFSGVGVTLPRVSRNQFNVGQKVPISDLRPGDMVFFQNPGAPIHHVAMFVGDGKMIEAPYTGGNVRIVPLRTRGLLPEATRVL